MFDYIRNILSQFENEKDDFEKLLQKADNQNNPDSILQTKNQENCINQPSDIINPLSGKISLSLPEKTPENFNEQLPTDEDIITNIQTDKDLRRHHTSLSSEDALAISENGKFKISGDTHDVVELQGQWEIGKSNQGYTKFICPKNKVQIFIENNIVDNDGVVFIP